MLLTPNERRDCYWLYGVPLCNTTPWLREPIDLPQGFGWGPFGGDAPIRFQGHIEKGMVVLDQPLPLPDGTPARVEAITPVPTDFWLSSSLDELARRQGVSAPASLEDLLGGWPMDELHDNFEESFLGWRERELEQRP